MVQFCFRQGHVSFKEIPLTIEANDIFNVYKIGTFCYGLRGEIEAK